MFEKIYKKKRILRGVEIEDSIMTITEDEKAILETPFEKKELNLIWFFALAAIIVLLVRVFYLDVVKGKYYSELSKGNRIRSIVIKAPRGKILDRYGKVLVRNIPSIDVVIIPSDLPEKQTERDFVAGNIAHILSLEKYQVSELMESLNKKSLNPILLKENITQDQALIISERAKNLAGISLENTAIRSYEFSVIFAPIIGYDGKITKEELVSFPNYLMTDYIGKSGLEKEYEKVLRGMHGAKQVEVDSIGNIKKNLGVINPRPGQDLILNVDEGLQKKLYDSLSSVLEKTGTKTAAAAAIDPKSGGVLALVSLPSYDNNLFAQGISSKDYQSILKNTDLPLFNRVINGEYPPGSTLKPAIAVAALSEGTITAETTVNDSSGMINVGQWKFGDWKIHGLVNVRSAIAQSCDVFFYSIGGGYGNIIGLGMDRMKKYETYFGFGSPTGIDLPGESAGLIPDEQWKLEKIGEKWYIGDSYNASIGQGYITATPIQLASYTSAIANNGVLYSPRIANAVKRMDGFEEHITAPIIRKNFIDPNILATVREGMRMTVSDGSARSLNDLPVEVAGKTGTAEFGSENKTHAWFISFAPYENPQIALAVLVEGGGEGSSLAVPVTKEVYEWYFSKNE